MHTPIQSFRNALAYVATAISYDRKMFAPGQLKTTEQSTDLPVVNFINMLHTGK
jgi:hypothetical protein